MGKLTHKSGVIENMGTWTLYGNTDKIEGRGRSVARLRFSSEAVALEALDDPRVHQAFGCMGTKSGLTVEKGLPVPVFDSVAEAMEAHELKTQALQRRAGG